MSDYQERRQRIRDNLKIQSVSHGQVHTCLIGMAEIPQISDDRRNELAWSLQNHQGNLIPIVVRRNDRLGADLEYEVIYGAEWVVVADALGIEMLWAWVFDLNDDEVAATREELTILLDAPTGGRSLPNQGVEHNQGVEQSIPVASLNVSRDELVQLFDERLDRYLTRQETLSPAAPALESVNHNHSEIAHQLQALTQKVEQLSDQMSQPAKSTGSSIESMQKVLESLERSASAFGRVIVPGTTITVTVKIPADTNPNKPLLTRDESEKLYKSMTVDRLQEIAQQQEIELPARAKKAAIVECLVAAQYG
ncbi:MAG: hypothetical protein EA001_02550 [Oscillatoriales cyanobacterium]|nr:MAG: hypothetical protein EA001_02550 [Oscillatoriales cyanobacterium]